MSPQRETFESGGNACKFLARKTCSHEVKKSRKFTLALSFRPLDTVSSRSTLGRGKGFVRSRERNWGNSARFHFSKGFVFVDYDHVRGWILIRSHFRAACWRKKERGGGRGRRKEKWDGKSRGFDFTRRERHREQIEIKRASRDTRKFSLSLTKIIFDPILYLKEYLSLPCTCKNASRVEWSLIDIRIQFRIIQFHS